MGISAPRFICRRQMFGTLNSSRDNEPLSAVEVDRGFGVSECTHPNYFLGGVGLGTGTIVSRTLAISASSSFSLVSLTLDRIVLRISG